MANSQYLEKLRDPRWQKKRLEIMERDFWCCQMCFDSKSTLNVHHRYYEGGREPWDYPNGALVTLCEYCHKQEGEDKRESEANLLRFLRGAGAMNHDLDALADAFTFTVGMHDFDWSVLTLTIKALLADRRGSGEEWHRMIDRAHATWKAMAAAKDRAD